MTIAKVILTSGLALVGSHAAPAADASCPNPAFQANAAAAIESYEKADVFSGAVLVAVDGKPTLRRGVGLASRELGVNNTPQTKFRIGSITKQFTATAILQLQEAGKLQLDEPISKYYPDAPASWSKITLRHLLTHTSGIPTYTALPGFFDREGRQPHTPEELIKLTRDRPLQFEPGKSYAYDNSGYVLLGYVVEKVSGQKYADYVQQHIFAPLGMTSSGYDDPSRITPNRAAGYERGADGVWRNAPFLDMSVPYAAGSLYSTVDDLLKWDQAIYQAKLLTPASLKAMSTDYGNKYGFGLVVDQKWDQDRIWHNGGIQGFTASFQRYPKARVTAIALNNEESPATDKLAADLAGLCLGAAVYPKEATETPANLQRYAGYYQAGPIIVRLEPKDGGLLAHSDGQVDVPYTPQGGGKFFAPFVETQLAFQTGPDGQVVGALVTTNGQATSAKRIDAAETDRLAQERAARVAAKVAAPGSEEALRRVIGELQRGTPDYSRLSPRLADATRLQISGIQGMLAPLGAPKSVTFQGVGPAGADIFVVAYDHGAIEWRILLDENGQILGLNFRPAS